MVIETKVMYMVNSGVHIMKFSQCIMPFYICDADHLAFHASLSSPLPYRASWWPLQCTLECVPDFQLPRDLLHCCHSIPEHQGLSLITHSTTSGMGADNSFVCGSWFLCFLLQITKLKIDNNPFAKGFRDEGMNSKRWATATTDLHWLSFPVFCGEKKQTKVLLPFVLHRRTNRGPSDTERLAKRLNSMVRDSDQDSPPGIGLKLSSPKDNLALFIISLLCRLSFTVLWILMGSLTPFRFVPLFLWRSGRSTSWMQGWS